MIINRMKATLVMMVMLGLGCVRQPEQIALIGDDNLVHIRLSDGIRSAIVNTRASVFQRFAVHAVSSRFVCFTSSDIGSRAYELDDRGTIHELPSFCLSNRLGIFYVVYNKTVRNEEAYVNRTFEEVRIVGVVDGRIICRGIRGGFLYSANSIVKYGDTGMVIKGLEGDMEINLMTFFNL